MFTGAGFQALGIDDWDCSVSLVESFRAATGVTYPLLRLGSATATAWGVYNQGIIIDGDGIVRFVTGTHQLPVAAMQDTIETYLMQLAADEPRAIPASVVLHPAFPNPFNPSAEIRFEIGRTGQVKLTVFDLLGREVAVLADEMLSVGSYARTFDGRGLASGVYLFRLDAGGEVQTRKMVLLK